MNVACSTLHASYCVAILIRVPAIRRVAIVMLLIDTMAILTAMCAAALAGLKCFPYIGGVASAVATAKYATSLYNVVRIFLSRVFLIHTIVILEVWRNTITIRLF